MASNAPGASFDVGAFIDERPVGPREILVLFVVAIMLLLDGFDMYFLGKILPRIAEGLQVTSVQMASVVTYQQIGMFIGALIMPPLADRIGRKPVLALCLLGFGGLSLLAGFSTSVPMLAWLRGISGVFFSAMLPVGLALLSETTPKKQRALFLSIALVCFSGGNITSGVMTAWWLDELGWQGFFFLGGVLPLGALFLLTLVPESLSFRVNRNPLDQRIAPMLRKIDTGVVIPENARFFIGGQAQVARMGPLAMFSRQYLPQTVLLFAMCFFSMGNIALLANYLPTLLFEYHGLPLETFAFYMIIGYAGGACGTLVMGWLMDRVSPFALIAFYFVVDAVMIFSIGQVPPEMAIAFVIALVMWTFCQTGGQTGINNLATLAYPPEMRSSGIGWAGAFGRFGGIVFPFLGGLALAATLPLQTIMAITAVPALCIAALVLVLGKVNGGKVDGRARPEAGEADAF